MNSNTGINKVFLLGHVKNEPRRHKNPNSADTLCFKLVTRENYRKGDSVTAHEEYHDLVICTDNSDVKDIPLKAGSLLHVTGKIQTKNWVDNDKIRRYKTEIHVLQLQLV